MAPQLLIWLFCVSAGIITGSSIYERVVVTPLWAGELPQSVRRWEPGVIQEAFFAIATPAYGL